MFFLHSQEQDSDHLFHEAMADPNHQSPSPPCENGHRSTISLRTDQGGTFCFLCFSNLLSDQRVPTVHVSYALHQLSIALSEPIFIQTLLSSHVHFLVSPVVHALSSIDDAPIAIQIMDTISFPAPLRNLQSARILWRESPLSSLLVPWVGAEDSLIIW